MNFELYKGAPMALEEKLNLGKKIFFINPPFDLKGLVMPMLFISEFEVYTISDYRYAKPILLEYPDSICFVCIDDGLTINQWANFIISISNDPSLSNVFFGVMSAFASTMDKNDLLLNANIPAGFISLNDTKEDLADKIKKILVLNEAKGVRKYIRAKCNSDRRVHVNCNINDTEYNLAIDDISSAGILCVTSLANKSIFKDSMLIRNLTIHLLTGRVKCNAVILRTYEKDNKFYMAILFTKGLPYATKASIQTFIQYSLQTSLELKILGLTPDNTDYSKRIIEEKIEDAFLIEVEDEIVYADDLYDEDVQLIDDTQ